MENRIAVQSALGTSSKVPLTGDVIAYPASFLPTASILPRHAGEAWREEVAHILQAGVVEGAQFDRPPIHPAMASIVTRLLRGDMENFSPEIQPNPALKTESATTLGQLIGSLDAVGNVALIGLGLAAMLWVTR